MIMLRSFCLSALLVLLASTAQAQQDVAAPAENAAKRLLGPLQISATGLSAQHRRIETIAENIANAQTTRTPEGGPYRRKVVQLEAIRGDKPATFATGVERAQLLTSRERHFPRGLPLGTEPTEGVGVRVTGIEEDATPGRFVYDPGHPDANADGYVLMPNVDVTIEMADLMVARRVYEANATVFNAAKSVLRTSIQF